MVSESSDSVNDTETASEISEHQESENPDLEPEGHSEIWLKGKLRSRNILPYMKAHIPSISKIVVIWCSTDLNLSSGSLKSLKVTTLERQRPPS